MFQRFRRLFEPATKAATPVHIGTVPAAIHAEQVPPRVSPAIKPFEQTDEQKAQNAAIDKQWNERRAALEQGLRDGTWRPQFCAVSVLELQYHDDPEVRALFTDEGRLKIPDQLTPAQADALIGAGAVDVGMGFGQRTTNATHFKSPQPPAPTPAELARLKEARALKHEIKSVEDFYAQSGLSDADLEAEANGNEQLLAQLKAKRAELFAHVEG